jgi:anthranilate synthase component 1
MSNGQTDILKHHLPDCEVWQFNEILPLSSLKANSPERYPFLLQSVVSGTRQSRFDILMGFPTGQLVLDQAGNRQPGSAGSHFLEALDAWWQKDGHPGDELDWLPFRGGWALYLSYELAAEIEPGLCLSPATDGLPVAMAARCPAGIIVDHETGRTSLVAEHGHQDLLELMRHDLDAVKPAQEPAGVPPLFEAEEDDPQDYLAAVRRIKTYIHEGDVFQVNLSREWRARIRGPLSDYWLYRQLCETNPATFAAWFDIESTSIISSSPERLVEVRGRQVQTRPIAGTRPRDIQQVQDKAYSDELLAHPKERAEHIMLIDLERNDLGRICVPGSIEVNELMVLESYAHVHHIVSNIRGALRKDVGPGDVIRAVFPGGTITGCPKVRCMEIIAELEQCGRGAYTGSLGYLNRNGDMDLNILIRTMVREGKLLHIRAGAGIVSDSDPAQELQETRAKARGMLRSIGAESA